MIGFLDSIQSFLDESGMSPTRLGIESLGDPTFVRRVMHDRVPRLDTADRVLDFMGRAPVGPVFRREVEVFLAVTRTKPYLLGFDAAGDPSFVARLRGGKNPRLDTVGRVRAWMDAHCTNAERREIQAMVGNPKATSEAKEESEMKSRNQTNQTNRIQEMNAMQKMMPCIPMTRYWMHWFPFSMKKSLSATGCCPSVSRPCGC